MRIARQFFWLMLVWIALLAQANPTAAARLVLVFDRDMGHALLFRHKENCFALLPSHVAANDRFAVELPLQSVVGSGTVFLRDADRDLAIAYIEGDIAQFCETDWNSFDRDLRRLLEQETVGEILRLSPEGIQDRTDAQIFAITPDTLVVRTTDALADGRITQSDSGSILVVDGKVAGIAQSALNGREANFFRIDEIVRRVGPLFEGGLSSKHPDQAKTETASGFRVTGWSGVAGGVDASELERGLLTEPLIFPWTGDPVQVEITLDQSQPVAFQGFDLFSAFGQVADHSPPKAIQIEADVGTPERPHWRVIAQPDAPPSGVFSFDTGGTFARRIRVTVQSIWFADRTALRIDALTMK